MTAITSNPYYDLNTRYVADKQANADKQNYADVSRDRKGTASGISQAPATTVDSLPSMATAKFQDKLAALIGLNSGSEVAEAKPIWEWSEGQYRKHVETQRTFMEMERRALEIEHTQYPDTTNDPRLKIYATVIVGGKTVASVDNQGMVMTENDALARKLQGLLADQANRSGPDLAKAMAEQIAKLLDGNVKVADTAIGQSDFDRLSLEARPRVNHDAMVADMRYRDLQKQSADLDEIERKRVQYLNQIP